MKKIIPLFLLMFIGCATGSVKQLHQQKLQGLDAQFKAGQIDADQYKSNYVGESKSYSHSKWDTFKKVMAFLWEAHLAKM